ncbi:MAG: ribonuclease D [Geminicoccaceae bacterium]|nr:ribonuclease D [Geminicoccaceae bacterium]MDW8123878.1 ribonuclease D [Geminicoccaceae bacterium]MDW8340059.1 ribonuclease D [Geminicoccaceae bacterium]
MKPVLHRGDLPEALEFGPVVAIDTETTGLDLHRDRLCLVQLSDGSPEVHLVKIERGQRAAPRLAALLTDPNRLKLFHFARFDLAMLRRQFGVLCRPVWCTKIASKLARTYTDRHGLKDLCRELLGIELSKNEQSSDWAAEELTEAQLRYAASDVVHLHALKERLEAMLEREERRALAEACMAFLPTRVELDLAGFADLDPFAH